MDPSHGGRAAGPVGGRGEGGSLKDDAAEFVAAEERWGTRGEEEDMKRAEQNDAVEDTDGLL